jgi:phosphonate transport system permease protein
MNDALAPRGIGVPRRFERPSPFAFVLWVAAAALVIASLQGIGFSASGFIAGLPNMGRILGEMFPPSVERIGPVGKALLETFQMALVGTVVGVLVSLPLAVLATRHLAPHAVVYHAARALIALFRTVPDLIWALFFVVTVGLGPFAGTLAIIVDIIGFCGRFFAEAMEEADRGPQEALHALGASRAAVIGAAVIPAAMPSFVNTSLFSLEKATRSSVVLGLVGAGGIGIELQVSMDLFRYSEASAIIIAIFVLVVAVEQGSAWLRRRLI